ncbi:hypothetical protein AYI68_g1873 [Smittium mucronatum]|uniref:Uncharacterized protein n=1 Tax=Smittium mucronatum TaxID=133383 RepID=A0A1R0H4A3_9FUNG|nr:hypothetical protein AYI68_g1873 [Smittium mucronatum]
MESKRGKDECRVQGASRSNLCSQTHESDTSLIFGLLRQQDYTRLFKEVWRNNFLRTTRDSGENIECFLENK